MLKPFHLKLNEALFAEVGSISKEIGLSPAALVELCILKAIETNIYADYNRQTLNEARKTYSSKDARHNG